MISIVHVQRGGFLDALQQKGVVPADLRLHIVGGERPVRAVPVTVAGVGLRQGMDLTGRVTVGSAICDRVAPEDTARSVCIEQRPAMP